MPVATYPDLAGASVFITGGGSGIGAALTSGFLSQGAKVAFVQRSDASAFVAQMQDRHGTAPLFLPCDISDLGALRGAIAQAEAAHGPVTVLVNNAANDTRHDPLETTPEAWEAAMNVNLRPVFFAAQAVLPGMRARGGAIINFSSITYMMGMAGLPAYVTAKGGIVAMTRALAREYGPDRVRVNAIAPGWVLTERQKRLWATPEGLEAFLEKQCLKEHLEEDDMVDTTLFLASRASRMITGQVIAVDGGVVTTG